MLKLGQREIAYPRGFDLKNPSLLEELSVTLNLPRRSANSDSWVICLFREFNMRT